MVTRSVISRIIKTIFLTWNEKRKMWHFHENFKFQVDLRHQEEEPGTNIVHIGVDLSEFYMSVEWDILAVPAIRNVKFYTCCDEPYLDITFNITMRRKTLFYTVNLIIPCMGISFLTVLVFYLPSDSGEKVFFTSNHKISQKFSIFLHRTAFFHFFKRWDCWRFVWNWDCLHYISKKFLGSRDPR